MSTYACHFQGLAKIVPEYCSTSPVFAKQVQDVILDCLKKHVLLI